MIVSGYARLARATIVNTLLSLEDLYLGVLIAAKDLGVRLRPELKVGESFQDENVVEDAVRAGALTRDMDLLQLLVRLRVSAPPESLLRAISTTLTDRYYGLESLALASTVERVEHAPKIQALPDIPGVAQSSDEKLALGRAWLRCWRRAGFWLSRMPPAWWLKDVQPRSGKFDGNGPPP